MPEERNEWKMELLRRKELDLQIWTILSLSISEKVRKRVQERTLRVYPIDHWIRRLISVATQTSSAIWIEARCYPLRRGGNDPKGDRDH